MMKWTEHMQMSIKLQKNKKLTENMEQMSMKLQLQQWWYKQKNGDEY